MRLPANGIPKFDGIDDLRRLVQAPPRVLDDVEQDRVSNLVEELYDVGEHMPFGYRSRDLAHALATVDRPGAEHARESEQVRAAWDVRFGTDPTDQAAIGARIDELMAGAPATLESQRGVAELRTLLRLSTDASHVPTELGSTALIDDRIHTKLVRPLVRDGRIGAAGAELIQNWQLLRDPARNAAWRSTIDDVARGHGELPADSSLRMVLWRSSGFDQRSREQRMRLLDAIARAGDGPEMTVRARLDDRSDIYVASHPDVASHLSRQVNRALRGESPLPAGIATADILESWHYRRAPFSARVALMEAHAKTNSRPLFEEYQDMRDGLDAAATEVARRQVDRMIGHAFATASPVPSWIEPGDVLRAGITESMKANLLSPWRGEGWAATPNGAAYRLVQARLMMHAYPMGGGAAGTSELRASTLAMIDRNIKRIVSDVDDGYEGHPDYAEVGRVESNLALLQDFQAASVARLEREAAATSQASARADATLSW